jgi:hypothetical protein
MRAPEREAISRVFCETTHEREVMMTVCPVTTPERERRSFERVT